GLLLQPPRPRQPAESAENRPGSASATAGDIGMRIKGANRSSALAGWRAERGADSAVARIAHAQGRGLGHALREAVRSYNDVELSRRRAAADHIRRQLEIVGGESRSTPSCCEEEMLEEDGDEGGCEGVGGGRRARLLVDIESRDRELRQLERGVRGVQEVFLDMAVLTVEQGEVLESIPTEHRQHRGSRLQETVGPPGAESNKTTSNKPL
ncbi:hypothetical protein CRUP_026790, partial [Coryphaenoides rupestris]